MIKLLPQKHSLVKETVLAIRHRIERGDYFGQLPGENSICTELGISRTTLRKALPILENQKLIGKASKGRHREILHKKARNRAGSKKLTISFLCRGELEDQSPFVRNLIREVRDSVEVGEGKVIYQSIPIGPMTSRTLIRNLQRMVSDSETNAWILYNALPAVAEWFGASGIPAIACGGDVIGKGIPVVSHDGVSVIRRFIEMVTRRGHRNVALIDEAPSERMLEAFHSNCLEDHSSAKGYSPELNGDPGRLIRRLNELSRRPQSFPTAFLVMGVKNLITLYTWLGKQGMKIPENASVVYLGHDPVLEWLHPEPAYFDGPHKPLALKLLKSAIEVIDGTLESDSLELLEMKFNARQSIADVE